MRYSRMSWRRLSKDKKKYMTYTDSIQELLEEKEGEQTQFKEAKNRFDFGDAAKCCCALANNGGGKFVFGITASFTGA